MGVSISCYFAIAIVLRTHGPRPLVTFFKRFDTQHRRIDKLLPLVLS